MDELNTLIESLAGEGRLHSEGEFTITLDHAVEKLAAYRLAEPSLFVLNLVAAAVVGGADTFTAVTGERFVSFTFNHYEAGPRELEELFTYILDSAAAPHLRELALAVHGAQALADKPTIELVLTGSGESWRGRVEGKQVVVTHESEEERRPGLEFTLRYARKPVWASLLGNSGNSSGHILDRLFHYCRYAPLKLTLNGRPKGHAVSLGVHEEGLFAWCRLVGEQQLRSVQPGRRHDIFISRREKSPVASSMTLALTGPELASRTGLLIISRGVAFRRPNRLLGSAIACGVVTADHLEKNLSQSDLIEDDAYRELLKTVEAEVERLIVETCSEPPHLTPTLKSQFDVALNARFEGREAPPELQTYRRLSRLRDTYADSKALHETVQFLLEKSSEADESTRYLRKEVLEVLRSRAVESLTKGEWSAADDFLGYLVDFGARQLNPLRTMVRAINEDIEGARQVYAGRSATEELPPALELLTGVTDEVSSDSVPTIFALFERAVWARRLKKAATMAVRLENAHDTPFLLLWLGCFARLRGEFQKAAELWERCLATFPPEDRRFWWPYLWGRLRGRVPFPVQIRWEVKRGFESLGARLSGQEQRYASLNSSLLSSWVFRVWEQRERGDYAGAANLFRQNYLPALIEARQLRVLSPTLPDHAVTLPGA